MPKPTFELALVIWTRVHDHLAVLFLSDFYCSVGWGSLGYLYREIDISILFEIIYYKKLNLAIRQHRDTTFSTNNVRRKKNNNNNNKK
jgi:hypothetical protein